MVMVVSLDSRVDKTWQYAASPVFLLALARFTKRLHHMGMHTTAPNFLPEVKAQYESLPYPPVDPQDERKRLQRTWLDCLPMLNHYCFGGRQTFSQGFRVLVAGGGTGDATIYLAEQLRHTSAEIVHLDLSSASIGIAQERARIRGLANIRWIQDSLLNIPALDLGQFDYINCVGVLHHLTDPDAGLRAIGSALKPDGAMGVMLYGAIGRLGIYHMQSALRLANQGCGEAEKIAQAKELLRDLPHSNWFRLAADLYGDTDSDAGIFDMLLHSQDRAYTVPELYAWLEDTHGYRLTFTDVNRGRFPYRPDLCLPLKAPQMRARLPHMSGREQATMAELLVGDITRHAFYLTHSERACAPYGDADFIPYFYHEPLQAAGLAALFAAKPALTLLEHRFIGMEAAVDAGRFSGFIFGFMDGQRTFGQIFDLVRALPQHRAAPPTNEALFADFRASFDLLNAIERILLRHVSCR
jgi:2-polyprenyl-3-methyl-5-hydroxy-6-metoxy-1,4-benzoquinol methylase